MPPMNGSFDATQFAPSQTMQAHPAGIYDASISATAIHQVKDKQAGRFEVEFTTPAGRIKMNYNLWADPNQEKGAKMVEIAMGQLSALCHATGIFRLDWGNEGAALRGGRCKIEVGPQSDNDKYAEVKRVLDAQGNEPGRNNGAASNPPNQGSNTAPNAQAWGVGGSAPVEAQNTQFAANTGPNVEQQQSAQNPNQGWGNAQPQAQQNQQPQGNGQQAWGQQPNQQQAQPQQQPTQGQAWQPGPQAGPAGGAPPWGQ